MMFQFLIGRLKTEQDVEEMTEEEMRFNSL